MLVLAHQVAGAEPGVARLEDVAQDLSLGLGLRRHSPRSAPPGFDGVLQDLADRLADLVGGALDAEAVGVAHRLLGLDVEAHELGREAVREERGNAADRRRACRRS